MKITLVVNDLEEAFPDAQTGGIRLILTQSAYLVQRWLDVLGPDSRVVLTADRASLERVAPEALTGRGPWGQFDIVTVESSGRSRSRSARFIDEFSEESTGSSIEPFEGSPAEQLLARAFRSSSVEERLQLCREASDIEPKSEVVALALASACREAGDTTNARRALYRAHKLAPNWEAVYYEDGKLWLSLEDMERARASFRRAVELMPTFSAAWANLGATLGELNHLDAGLEAFIKALKNDPRSFTILNNIGIVTRELGRLGDSEDALREVIALAPEFASGYYNLGFTRFLRGNYPGALQAYEEGRRHDPDGNRRERCRLALVKLANRDAEGAERDLWQCADEAGQEEREELLFEAYEIGQALLKREPSLQVYRPFVERIAAALAE